MRNVELFELKRMRKRLGITQEKLAEKAGVSQAYIAKLETGQADPKLSTYQKIVDSLKSMEEGVRKASDVMVNPIISIDANDFVENAIRLMSRNDISQIPVTRRGRIVGCVVEKSLIKKIDVRKMEKFRTMRVYEVMDDPLPTVSRNESLESVFSLLKENNVVVVEEIGKPVGIISRSDILGLLMVKS
ncbi:MAG: CBS domain-containing protein [Theionarchaea archaeon]|nr:CBS domain-containing protein [Theionarchaea archaeon]